MEPYHTYKEPGQPSSLSLSLQKETVYKTLSSSSVPIRPLTIANLLRLWEKELEFQAKPATYSVYAYQVERTLIPCLGSLPAKEFGEKELEEFLRKLGKGENISLSSSSKQNKSEKKNELEDSTKLSESTLYSLEIILRRAFSYAIEQGILEKNPLGRLRTRPCRDAQVEILEPASIQVLKGLLAMEEPKTRLEILLPLYTGCTLSELCALSWQEVDLVQATLTISRNLIRVKQTASAVRMESGAKTVDTRKMARRVEIVDTRKTASEVKTVDTGKTTGAVKTTLQLTDLEPKKQRLVRIPALLCKELEEFYNSQNDDMESKTIPQQSETVSALKNIYLLTGTTSYPEPRTYQKHVQTTLSRCGIANGSLTMLRDTYAAMCLRCGAPEYSLARQMGVETGRLLERYEEFLREDYSFVRNLT